MRASTYDVVRRSHFVYKFVMLFAVVAGGAAPQATSRADDWSAFRGGGRAGNADELSAPLRWSGSSNENIRWRTPIPGRGHSSPVVRADRVYLTTAYSSTHQPWIAEVLTWISIVILAPVAAVVGRRATIPLRDRPSWSSRICLLANTAAMLSVLTAIGFMLVYAENVFEYKRCPIRHWLGTSLLLSLCIILMTYVVSRASRWNLLFAAMALTLAAWTYLGIPSRDHAFRGGNAAPNALVVWAFLAIPAVLGVACLASFARERFGPLPVGLNSKRARRISTFALICLTVLVVLGSAVLGSPILTGTRAYQVPPAMAFTGWVVCAMVAAAAVWMWSMRDGTRNSRAEAASPPRAFARLAISFGAMLIVCLIAGLALSAAISASPYLSYHLPQMRMVPQVNALSVIAAVVVVAFGMFVEVASLPRPRLAFTSTAAIGCLAMLGGLQMASTNAALGPVKFSRAIVCLDAHTGKHIWTREGLAGPQGVLHRANSPATPTPVVVSDRVFSYFGSAGLMCTNLEGRLLWENRDLTFESAYGVGTSPVFEDGVIVIFNGSPETPHVCALDASTGKSLWRQSTDCRPDWVSGSSRTPLIMTVSGHKCVVLWDISALKAYDLRSGELRWKISLDEARGDMVASVGTDGRRIYCSGPQETIAIELNSEGLDPQFCWRTRFAGANCASPVCSDGLLFVVTDNGVLTCVDADTGKICWRKRLAGEFFSNLLVAAGKLYATNSEGGTTVIGVDRQFRMLSENELGQPTVASFAVGHGRIYARDESHAICLAEPELPLEVTAAGALGE